MGLFDAERHPSADWELRDPSRTFKARYNTPCVIEHEHQVQKNKVAGQVHPIGQPMSPKTGVACAECVGRIKARKVIDEALG